MRFNTSKRIIRKFSELDRGELDYDERWNGDDGGLIMCWENGRKWRQEKPELTSRAMNGELPSLVWRGGISDDIKCVDDLNAKYGTLYYLAKLLLYSVSYIKLAWSDPKDPRTYNTHG